MPSFTEKGQKSPNSCTEILWDVILKTTIPRLVESFEHIKCNRSNSQRHVKSFINPTRYNFQKICSWTRRNETIGKMKRITIFFDQQVFINYRKKTRQYFIAVELTSTFLKTVETIQHSEEPELSCMKVQVHSFSQSPLQYIQPGPEGFDE